MKLRLALVLLAAFGILLQLATFAGLGAGVVGVGIGYVAADRAARSRLRLGPTLLAALVVPVFFSGLSALIARFPLGMPPVVALYVCDGIGVLGVALALAFIVHLLSERVTALAVLEPLMVMLSLIAIFASHRHHRIEHPRFLSDWAWSHGIDPVTALSVLGVAGALLAALLLLRGSARGVILLLLFAAAVVFLLPSTVRLPNAGSSPQSEQDQKKKDENQDDQNQGGGAGGQQKPPHPVAIVVLHDELPADIDAIYLRQAVLSRISGDRLIEDNSGQFDRDVLNHLPAPEVESPQNPKFHSKLHTSIYLLVDHAALFSPAQAFGLRAIPNPSPGRFVGAYDADSYWLRVSPIRLAGRSTQNEPHYSEAPADPRYLALSKKLVRDVDPRFVGDEVMSAFAIKHYLEKNGIYNGKKKTLSGEDPTASFLFGDMRGYCVHFAHAAALLLRSQGIASRVALGYAVQTRLRGAGSSILVLETQAHAWPEIFVEGVGWVTFDIHPERSEDPPPQLVDVELESMLGEMARKEEPKVASKWRIPPRVLLAGIFASLFLALLVAYAVKLVRRVRAASPTHVYRAVLDQLTELGAGRRLFETRERHAERVRAIAPSFVALTNAQMRWALGKRDEATLATMRALARATRDELTKNTQPRERVFAWLNPIGWWFTR